MIELLQHSAMRVLPVCGQQLKPCTIVILVVTPEPYVSCLLILLIPFNHEAPILIGAMKQQQHMPSYCTVH